MKFDDRVPPIGIIGIVGYGLRFMLHFIDRELKQLGFSWLEEPMDQHSYKGWNGMVVLNNQLMWFCLDRHS
jgi:hypothetical protein